MQVQKNNCKWEILGDLSAPRFLTQRCLGVREREQPQFVSQTFLFGQNLKDARVKDLRLCQLGLMLPGWRATRHKIYSDHNLSSASPYQRWSVVNTCKGMSKPIIFLHQLVCCKLPRYVPPSIYTNDIQSFLRVKTCQANQFFPQVSSCWYQVVPSYIIHWSSKLPKN